MRLSDDSVYKFPTHDIMGIHLTEKGKHTEVCVGHPSVSDKKEGGKYESGEKLRAGIQAGFPLCAAARASVDFRFLHTGIFSRTADYPGAEGGGLRDSVHVHGAGAHTHDCTGRPAGSDALLLDDASAPGLL